MANWIGHGANLLVMLFLSPFVIHSLGKTSYGVWSLLMTVTGYLGLAEIGVRASTGRYINYYIGLGRQDEVDRVVSTSLVFYTLLSCLLLVAAGLFGAFFGSVFRKVPSELAGRAKWVLLLTAISVWLGFMASVFGQLLRANNRFDLRAVVIVAELAVRAGGTVLALSLGGKLVALAAVLTASGAVGFVLFVLFARWRGTRVKLSLRSASRQKLTELLGYGSWAFVQNISIRIIAYTDAVVIALLLGMEEVAFYSIALALADGAGHFVAHVFRVLEPDTMKAGGKRDLPLIRAFILKGTRACLFLAVPLYVGFVTLGGDFIRLWMGPGFGASAIVLMILTFGQVSGALRWGSWVSLAALGFVRLTAMTAVVEAALNLALSVFFVVGFGWGIYGVAAGTVVPALLFANTLTVVYLRSRIGLTARTFVRQLVVPAGVAAALFAVPCLAARRLVRIDSWAAFAGTVAVLAVAYLPIGLFVFLNGGERLALYQRVQLFAAKAAGRRLSPQWGSRQ
ncbi:MAG: oligosaccharide flippase family protein [Planctomycetota bacterium]|jgi:O-antigen/teichoic acid export membrane protein